MEDEEEEEGNEGGAAHGLGCHSFTPSLSPIPAFTFYNEGALEKTNLRAADVPPGALIAYLQKGLEYVSIEEHINEVSRESWEGEQEDGRVFL